MVGLFRAGSDFTRVDNVGKNIFISEDLQKVEPPARAEAKRNSIKPSKVLLSVTADLGRACVVPDNTGLSPSSWYPNQYYD